MGNNNTLVDMIGFTVGNLTVVQRDLSKKSRDGAYWLCQCGCGNPELKSIKGGDLRAGRRKSCGKCKQFETIGKTFGRLTALEVAPNYAQEHGLTSNHIYYKCQCSCGNISYVDGTYLRNGHTQSCGCYGKEQAVKSRALDLTGQVFGRLTAMYPVVGEGCRAWRCKCSCEEGVECTVTTNSLTKGTTQSCGCLQREAVRNRAKDLTGQVFGYLTALYPTDKRRSGCVVWKCKCSRDGNECEVASDKLMYGDTRSCGCLASAGEANITTVLQENDIVFEQQKTYADFISTKGTGWKYRYDFYLPEHNRLIEFDGIQHYEPREYFGGAERFKEQQETDQLKNEYALEHNIPLVRIPYWEKDEITLEMLLGDKYLVYKKS